MRVTVTLVTSHSSARRPSSVPSRLAFSPRICSTSDKDPASRTGRELNQLPMPAR